MLIGLGHKRRVGKTTVANYLYYYHNFRCGCFADARRQVAIALGANTDEEAIFGFGLTNGQVLERVEMALRDAISPDIWVKILERNIAAFDYACVITDVRFPNEAAWIKSKGGVLWRIDRSGVDGDAHESEHALDEFTGWDAIIANNGATSQLYDQVDALLQGMAGVDSGNAGLIHE